MKTDEKLICWLKLHISVMSGVKVCSLVREFGSAYGVYAAGREKLLKSKNADEKTVNAILSADESKALSILRQCEKNNWDIITPDSEFYPEKLKNIRDFPFVLFASGNKDFLKKEPKVSVVGTRNASDKALMASYLLGCCLSSLDVVTVSGGALGIDSAAHEGALTGNGGTVAVLGCGLGSDYLPEKYFMRNRIKNNGVLISEFSPFASPSRYSFPKRNRIISALSDVTVVAESGEKGGSLITADYAVKQGKKVYCFDESIVSSPGCKKLTVNGANVFSTPGELLKAYSLFSPKTENAEKYLNYPLQNDGIHGVHIIKPSTMTPDSFAAYNGITPEEAEKVLGEKLRKSQAKAPVPAKKKQSSEKEQNKKAGEKTKPEATKKTSVKKTVPPKKEEIKQAKSEFTPKALPDTLSDAAVEIYSLLGDTPQFFDELQAKTALSIQAVMSAITELELEDLALLHPGNRVSRI